MPREPIALSWSGGKDSALALHALRSDPRYEVTQLITTCTEGFRRISMHGVRCSLLSRQTESLGLPCTRVFIPRECPNAAYEAAFGSALDRLRDSGIRSVAFGDLFLEDLRAYRIRLLAAHGMNAVFPLWGRNTLDLAREFIALGFRATLVCIDTQQIAASLCGNAFDETLLAALPGSADPCGENGEFHTFVHEGPVLRWPLRVRKGRVVQRDRFTFADLQPCPRPST